MKLRPEYSLPEEKQEKLAKAVRLEWITLFMLLTITIVMFMTMGASQAMKTAWIEDVLSMIPPIAFLLAMRYRDRDPDEDFPYGYRRSALLAFMVASVAILVLGLYMLYDSGMSLIKQHHPTLGHFELFGYRPWAGWVMIVALIYSVIPPIILGRMKLPLAQELHEKTLHADAVMNKADWMTGAAAVFGILAVGMGFWWGDSAAAAFIALDVVHDGGTNVRNAMADLMDRRPTSVERSDPLGLVEKINGHVRAMPGIRAADCRLREEGHVVSGEIFIVLDDEQNTSRKVRDVAEAAEALDWRIYDLVVMPVERIES